jgi:hypothetical protein
MTRLSHKTKGQGVVEYAGALVIAAVTISGILLAGPESLGSVFSDTMTTVGNYLHASIPGATGGDG